MISDLLEQFVTSLLASSTLLQDDNNLFQTCQQVRGHLVDMIMKYILWFKNSWHSFLSINLATACDPGQYLDVNSPNQSCKACKSGHYSLGGDVIYTNWTTLPIGFETQSFDDSSNQWSGNKKGNCTKWAEPL